MRLGKGRQLLPPAYQAISRALGKARRRQARVEKLFLFHAADEGALAFLVGGKQAFAMRVNLPAIAMPELSDLRSSLAETADGIRAGMTEAVVEALG